MTPLRTHTLSGILTDQRGIALPMAMMIVLILSALMAAFSVLGASEPTLAANQQRVAQARAIAESGVDRAIWALNNPGDASGIPNPLVTPAAPYDGSTAVPVMLNGTQVGVFTVSVTNGAQPNERNVVAMGWAPSNTGTGPTAKQKIQVTVFQTRFLDSPAALTVRGEISASGHSLIDARTDTSCGAKVGTYSKGDTTVGGSAAIYGADGNNNPYHTGDVSQGDATRNVPDVQPNSVFNQYTYSNDELDALKALAKANGTYYSGAQVLTLSFNSRNKMPNGIIYVDTVSGQNIDKNGANTTLTSDFASVDIDGNAPLDATGIVSGMLIVAGTLTIHGNFQMHGTVYVLNDFTYLGTGTGQIVGAVVSQNVRDVSVTSIDTDTGGNSTIIWNCSYARTGGGQLPQAFTIEAGTYKEISG
jgi:Tfp pilus assembly protein PilX